MAKYLNIILAAAAVIFALLWWLSPVKTVTVPDLSLSEANARLIADTIRLNDEVEHLTAQLNKTASDSKVSQRRFKIENSALRNVIAEKEVQIAHILDSLPAVAEVLDLKDSLILHQDARILELEEELRVTIETSQELLQVHATKLRITDRLLAQMSEENSLQAQTIAKSNRKLRRTRRLGAILTVVGFVSGVLLSN